MTKNNAKTNRPVDTPHQHPLATMVHDVLKGIDGYTPAYLGRFGLKNKQDVDNFFKSPAGRSLKAAFQAEHDIVESRLAQQQR